MKRKVFSVSPADEGVPVDCCIASKLHLDSALATTLVRQGAVYLDGVRCKEPKRRVTANQDVLVILEEGGRPTAERVLQSVPALAVLLEDEALIAVDKPPGILAQPGIGRGSESLLDQVAAYLGRAPLLVHRLDRETSGVTLFAKTRPATAALAEQFRNGSVSKRYLAVTGPLLPLEGSVDLPVSKDPTRIGRYRALKGGAGPPARTDFTRLFGSTDYSLAVLYPRTGRTHQIRAHLTALRAPIFGDRLYGGRLELNGRRLERCLLHAQGLQFTHPRTRRPIRVEAPVPEDLSFFFRLARVDPPCGAWGVKAET